jgi:6-phosphogluconate dehydrogenase
MVGLGRMGGNMTLRLMQHGHSVVAFDRSRDVVEQYARQGATPAYTLEEVVSKLDPPRAVWIMVPAGKPVEETIETLTSLMSQGDTVIDGGNSRWTDSMRRAKELGDRGFKWMDVGTSGGIWGLKVGYSMMIGADPDNFKHWEPIFVALAPEGGYGLVGPAGAGHFVKMVHNGVEYGMMEAYGEGFEIMKRSADYPSLDLTQIAGIWNHASVVRSWLLELLEDALRKDPGLESIRGYVEDSGEGRWTVEAAINTSVPAPVIALSLFQRFASREPDAFSNKVLAALRNEFGGHAVQAEPAGSTAGGE